MNRISAVVRKAALVSLVMMSTATTCNTVDPLDGNPDDVARLVEGMVRYQRTEWVDGSENGTTSQLRTAEDFAQELYFDCQQLAYQPELLGVTTEGREPLRNCSWQNGGPVEPSTCDQAVCTALASHCVAERLYALSRHVEDYESTRYSIDFESEERQIVVPPQTPRANAAMLEVAATYATHAITLAGVELTHEATENGKCEMGIME